MYIVLLAIKSNALGIVRDVSAIHVRKEYNYLVLKCFVQAIEKLCSGAPGLFQC